MASKRATKASADNEIDELFADIETKPTKGPSTAASASAAASTPAGKPPVSAKPKPNDILAELEDQLGDKAPSRPHTPRIATAKQRASLDQPPPSATGPRKSAESTRSLHAAGLIAAASASSPDPKAPASAALEHTQQQQPPPAAAAGGGWWGGIMSTANAAIKQAEAAVKEIQRHEETKKWADQVRGNVGALKGLSDGLASRALPALSNIMNTLAPPISQHERLLIHITHDLVGYPSLDPLVYGVFNRVMAQVEGGDLMVIQRGHENSIKSSSDEKTGFFSASHSTAGWRDGPWWRDVGAPRDLAIITGLTEGTKLCRASAEGYSTEYFATTGGIDAARQRAFEPVSESNPIRSSDLFFAVQAILTDDDTELFKGGAASSKAEPAEAGSSSALEHDVPTTDDELVCFAIYILDPVHEIAYSALSQSLPARWLRWMDAGLGSGALQSTSSPSPLTPASSIATDNGEAASIDAGAVVPDEIRAIVDSGGVDPREWVAEWIEEALTLAAGVVAQRYVARRMGVGEADGIVVAKGKRRMVEEEVVAEGGGEMARALG